MTRKQYISKLSQMYDGVPVESSKKAQELIERLTDVLMMMDECKEHLAAEGCVTEMSQGKYSIARENPYSRIYDAKHKLMLSTMDKLDKMQPDTASKRDELMEFLSGDGE